MLINLTPHSVTIYGNGPTVTVPPSGKVARCQAQRTWVDEIDGVPLYTIKYDEITGLPDPQPFTLLIVSMIVRLAVPLRADVVSPGEPVRNQDGQVIGCLGLNCNR